MTTTNLGGLLRYQGHASIFDKLYWVGRYEEDIARTAFTHSLKQADLDCVLRVEHEDLPLARTTGRVTLPDGTTRPTLILSEDSVGLKVDALLDPRDPDVARLVPKFKRGDLGEMSFAFRCEEDTWNADYTRRTIKRANLHRGDVAIVTYGASPTTSSTLRSRSTIEERRAMVKERAGWCGALAPRRQLPAAGINRGKPLTTSELAEQAALEGDFELALALYRSAAQERLFEGLRRR
jgi:HK97 family phage prohead protease